MPDESDKELGDRAPTRHAILGMGGVGGLIAALLAKAGDHVTAVVRPEALAQYPARLSLESPFGAFSVHVERATAVREPFDVLWIAVKATHLEAALGSVASATELGAIVPLLNGIDHVRLLRSRFGADRVVPATIAVESERVAPGRIVHRSPFLRLNISARGEARLAPVVEKLTHLGCSARFTADEPTLMWGKLAFLAPFALTTSAARMSIGEVVSDPSWRTHLERCAAEAGAVGVASGARLDPAAIIASLLSLPRGMRSSMQKDLAAGNEPEVDAIAGPILDGGRQFGISVPGTSELAAAVRAQVAAHL